MSDNAADRARKQIRKLLAGRHLIWQGIRGEDGKPLLEFPEMSGSFSITAPLGSAEESVRHDVTFESLSGLRPDLDRPDLDVESGRAAEQFRDRFMAALAEPSVVVPYRASRLTSALAFAMTDTLMLAGPLYERQSQFEYKPWVESSIKAHGMPGIDWRYVADEHKADAQRLAEERPQILRTSRTSGGAGVVLAETAEDVARQWPEQQDAFVAVAPFLEGATPLNFSGCVFSDGSVRLHPASVQLIGVAACTSRRFGYCGNDFGAVARLGNDVLDQVDNLGRAVGRWLHEHRYRGSYGIDALVQDGIVRFLEINPRFQGSSLVSATIASETGRPSLFADHLAAWLDLPPEDAGWSTREWAARQPHLAQMVIHQSATGRAVLEPGAELPAPPFGGQVGQLPRGVEVELHAALGRVTVERSITQTGAEVDAEMEAYAEALRDCFIPVV
jgi:hypothetical protein